MTYNPTSRKGPTGNPPYEVPEWRNPDERAMEMDNAAIKQTTLMIRLQRALERRDAMERNKRWKERRVLKCYLCEGAHPANQCESPMTVEQRVRRVRSTNACTLCLKPDSNHYPLECPMLRKRVPV